MSARLPHALRSRRRRRRRHLDQVRGLLTAAQWNWDMYNDSPGHVAASDLARKPVAVITSDHVEAFARWLRRRTCVSAIHTKAGVVLRETARPLSASMQKHALRLVRQALRAAGNTAADDVTIALGGPRPRDLSEDWLRADEIATLLACPGLPLRNRTAYACALGSCAGP